MLYIASVHYKSPRWVEIQCRYLRENIAVPYQTWTSLEGIDPSYGRCFDRVLEQRGLHASKLNHLAIEISHEASSDEDLLMFLDGDAFPIADPMPLISSGLAEAPLIAVRRAENVDQPQPHPCFCVTTVGTWQAIHGDWSGGYAWPGRKRLTSDVGGNLLRSLELSNTPWVQVLRSNRKNLDPLYYGIYGETIYHHGAGFHTGELSPAHRSGPGPPPFSGAPVLGAAGRLFNRMRWRRWERGVEARHVRQSQQIYERINAGGSDWLAEFT